MELNGAEGPVVAQMLKDVIDLPDGLALNDVMATKMNCKDGNGKRMERVESVVRVIKLPRSLPRQEGSLAKSNWYYYYYQDFGGI